MSRSTVVLFPGQGAYVPGALPTLVRQLPALKHSFAQVDAAAEGAGLATVSDVVADDLAPSLERLLQDEPPHILQLTLYATAVGLYRTLTSQGLRPVALAGHSLGEIAALVCGGAFTDAEGAEIVLQRTAAVVEANLSGAMTALGHKPERVQQVLDLVGDPTTAIAAQNSPRQTVVSGPEPAVDSVESIARALRISVVRLRSPFPFHSPLLAEASVQLARRLRHLHQRPLATPVYSPILSRYYTDGDRLTDVLAMHLTARVQFSAALVSLRAAGSRVFVEAGAGAGLTSQVKATVPDVQAVACVASARDPVQGFHEAGFRLVGLGVLTGDPEP